MLIRETENWPNVRIRNWGMRNKKKIVVLAVLANYKPLISSTSQWEERTLAEGNSLTSQTEQSYLKYSTNLLASNKSKILHQKCLTSSIFDSLLAITTYLACI